MPPRLCQLCHTNKALIRRPKTGQQVCKPCFFEVFETEVHHTITENGGIFKRGDKVAIGASGGKGAFCALAVILGHAMLIDLDLHRLDRLGSRYDHPESAI